MNRKKKGFSLIELSIVLIVIGVLISAVISFSFILQSARINSARNITNSSPVQDITGLTLWLDTIALKSFDDENIDDGDEVENWNDMKNSYTANYVATQSTSSKRPLYELDAINKLPGLTFDGSNDHLDVMNFSANSNVTIFIVGKFNNSEFTLEQSDTTDSNNGFYFYGPGTSTAARVRRGSNVQGGPDSDWFGNEAAIGVMRYDGTNISYKTNNNSFTDTADSTGENTVVTDSLYIGSRNGTSQFADGSFGEIIIYDKGLSDAEVDQIIDYLNTKWSIF